MKILFDLISKAFESPLMTPLNREGYEAGELVTMPNGEKGVIEDFCPNLKGETLAIVMQGGETFLHRPRELKRRIAPPATEFPVTITEGKICPTK